MGRLPTLPYVTDWISQVEAAKLLGVTSTSVYRMVSRGDLHPRPRHGMRPSMDRAEVLDLAARRTVQQADKRMRVRNSELFARQRAVVRSVRLTPRTFG